MSRSAFCDSKREGGTRYQRDLKARSRQSSPNHFAAILRAETHRGAATAIDGYVGHSSALYALKLRLSSSCDRGQLVPKWTRLTLMKRMAHLRGALKMGKHILSRCQSRRSESCGTQKTDGGWWTLFPGLRARPDQSVITPSTPRYAAWVLRRTR